MKRDKSFKMIELAIAYDMSPERFAELAEISKELAERMYQDVRDKKSQERDQTSD